MPEVTLSDCCGAEAMRQSVQQPAPRAYLLCRKCLKECSTVVYSPNDQTPFEAFVQDLLNCTRFTPGIVNHGEVLRLLAKHVPEYLPEASANGTQITQPLAQIPADESTAGA
jgi:hypothetical protein